MAENYKRIILVVILTCGTPFCEASDKPVLLLLRADWLAEAKIRLASGDSSLQPAYARLVREASASLLKGPFSVMDKTLIPPSGDKHDYMSFGPYWWPDPKKKDGLPYIRKDGKTNPESRTGATDIVRLAELRNCVDSLALAYYFSGEEKYAQHASLLMRTWFLDPATRMNPHLKYAEAIPGRVEGRGTGIIGTRSFPKLIDAAALIESSSAWTDSDQKRLREWFASYLDWLLTSAHGEDEADSRNNHGSWYDAQVVAYALFVGRTDQAREILDKAKRMRIAAQIEADGRQPEELARTKSFAYSAMNLTALFTLARLGEHVDLDLWRFKTEEGAGLQAALDYLAPFADPGKEWPYVQYRGVFRSLLFPLLRQGAVVYESPQYEEMIQKLPPEAVLADRWELLCPE